MLHFQPLAHSDSRQSGRLCAWLADGDFIANLTVVPGIRTPSSWDGNIFQSMSITASIEATCNSGIELEAVEAPASSANFSISYQPEQVVTTDDRAVQLQYWSWVQDLTLPNPSGLRAVWIG